MDSFKLIAVIACTFLIAFATSLLLEIPLFQNPVRYILVILLIAIEIYFGFLIYKFLTLKQKD